jgi:hypothetical protein
MDDFYFFLPLNFIFINFIIACDICGILCVEVLFSLHVLGNSRRLERF